MSEFPKLKTDPDAMARLEAATVAAFDHFAQQMAEMGESVARGLENMSKRLMPTCPSCRHGVEAHRVMDVCIIDDCDCKETP